VELPEDPLLGQVGDLLHVDVRHHGERVVAEREATPGPPRRREPTKVSSAGPRALARRLAEIFFAV